MDVVYRGVVRRAVHSGAFPVHEDRVFAFELYVAAVEVAFTEFISGRAPEKRGHGLKLVREVVTDQPIDLFYTSGDAEVRMKGPNKAFHVTRGMHSVRGCLAKIEF